MASAVVSSGYRATVTHQPILEQAPDVLRDVEALISVVTPVGEDELAALPNARAVISPIIGYDWIDVEAAPARGVLVAKDRKSTTSELQSLMRISYAVLCLKKKIYLLII